MITLDAIRAALGTPDPYTEMDQLVRVEMDAGRKVDDIFGDLNPYVNAVLDTPGLTDDGEEAFLGTLDALTGNCRSEDCYKDPPNNSLPTEEEIAQLPRWARVAFAARIARRVLPLFRIDWERDLELRYNELSHAVYLAERSAEIGRPDIRLSEVVVYAYGTQAPPVSGYVGNTVYDAVSSVQEFSRSVEHTRCATENLASVADLIGQASLKSSMLTDYTQIARLAVSNQFTDETPVPPEVFGPLWPEGPPPGWPADRDVPQRAKLPVAFLALGRVSPVILEDEAVNVFNALNRYYIARTGRRLTLEGDIRTFLSMLVGAGV